VPNSSFFFLKTTGALGAGALLCEPAPEGVVEVGLASFTVALKIESIESWSADHSSSTFFFD
jgi:hypothetical protein